MTQNKIGAWLLALSLLLPSVAFSQSPGIVGLPTAVAPTWVPGDTMFTITSPVNQKIGTTSFTGSISGTTLTTSSVSGVALAIGQTITFSTNNDVTSGTKITAGSGSSWTVNNSQTVASESMQAATYTAFTVPGWPSPTSSSPSAGFNYFFSGQIPIDIPLASAPLVTVTVNPGFGFAGSWGQPTTITIPMTIGFTGSPGDTDHHGVSIIQTAANYTGTITGNDLNVTAISSGFIANGQTLTFPGVVTGTIINGFNGGSGGTGHYVLTNSQSYTGPITSAGTTQYNFWILARQSNTLAWYSAYGSCDIYTQNGLATGNSAPAFGCGGTAIGNSVLAGIVMQAEVAQGAINHKIAVSLWNVICKAGNGSLAPQNDCTNSTGLMEGQILGIPPGTPQPAGLSPVGVMMFNAMTTFGAFTDDQAGATDIRVDASFGGVQALGIFSDLQKLIPLLQQVSFNHDNDNDQMFFEKAA